MSHLHLGPEDAVYYEYQPAPGRPTLVFVNALTGSTEAWQAAVAPRCRDAGFGTLCWNFRGQSHSASADGRRLDADLIAGDLRALIAELAPERPVLCGLSIGGLYAAKAILGGVKAEGLVLLNTLRRIGPRIAWINDAMFRAVATGGIGLLLDMFYPLLVNQELAAAQRPSFLTDAPYEPLPPDHGHTRLMEAAGGTDWDIPYERLTLPVLTVTGHQDRLFLDHEVVAELRGRLPDARHLDWADAGHLLPAECPERLAAALIDFAGGL